VQKSGSLPFTGLSLTAFVVLGVLLIAVGVVLRRRTNRSTS
jgi:LPXTG-motif cell wall-anchored protein